MSILKHTFILFARLTCILGAIWYLRNWFMYRRLGDNRPFTMVERQELRPEGAILPLLDLYSTEMDKIIIDGAWYQNRTNLEPLGHSEVNKTGINGNINDQLMRIKLDMPDLSNGNNMECVMVMISHRPPLTYYPWTIVNIVHPHRADDLTLDASTPGLFNKYYFRPGYYVEIRYIPTHTFKAYRPEGDASILQRLVAFLGFGGREEIFSYRSTVNHTPFPDGMYPNTTTIIILRPQSDVEVFYYAEEKIAFRNVMSNIGGLIGMVGSAIVFLFGSSLLSPWGFFSTIRFFRKRIADSMAKEYNDEESYSKGPFTTQIHETGKFDDDINTTETKITLLKERIDELEIVLAEYYLNATVFHTYSTERQQRKLDRAVSRSATMGPGKEFNDSGAGSGTGAAAAAEAQHWRQPSEPVVILGSQIPMSSVSLPSSDSHRRGLSSDPSASVYYAQQLQQSPIDDRRESGQTLMGSHTAEEVHDRSMQGLTPQDRYASHGSYPQP
ncbi:hypothetical protein B0O80DRAFT_447900 [Mortierella sp. GBAus27b]|nr:hypothetical protein B0O80DRAFT_447900 [Mortierella sp. GBAus27b]